MKVKEYRKIIRKLKKSICRVITVFDVKISKNIKKNCGRIENLKRYSIGKKLKKEIIFSLL